MLEVFYGLTVVQTAGIVTAVALSGISGTIVASKLGWIPREVLAGYAPLLLLSATFSFVSGRFYPGSCVGYIVAVCLQHFLIFGPNMALNADYTRELADVAGMASCIQLAGPTVLGSAASLPGLAAAAWSTLASSFVVDS